MRDAITPKIMIYISEFSKMIIGKFRKNPHPPLNELQFQIYPLQHELKFLFDCLLNSKFSQYFFE
jgi:hypothetical protein